ncbi:MAG: glycosyltransferase involved in cell wall biosynthesis [Polaribacter sp.]|jgi:glycosyltransferase involved in cell wall biosynthesis
MINVLHLRSSAGLYGAEHVILNLTQPATVKCKHHVVVFENHLNSNEDFYRAAQERNIKITKLNCNSKLDLGSVFTLLKLLKKHQSNVIHCHDPKSVFYAFLATIFNKKIRKVVTMHGWVKNDSNMRFNNFIEKLCLPFFNKIIAVSEEIKEKLISASLSKSKIIYIANAIDTNKFIPLIKSEEIKSKTIKLLIVGRLSPEKGHTNLLTALSVLNKKSITSWQLTIIGDGELKDTLREQAEDLGLIKQVQFLGVKKNTLSYYQKNDIYVSSSLSEGMPLVVLEAMSCQVPVISTPVGAIPDLIKNSKGGMLSSNSSVEAIIECLEKMLLLTTDELEELALNARQYIVKNFSISTAIEQHESLYQTLTVNHKQGALL